MIFLTTENTKVFTEFDKGNLHRKNRENMRQIALRKLAESVLTPSLEVRREFFHSNWKWLFVVSFFFFLLPTHSNAQLNSDYSYLTILTHNDNWGGAFTPIRDDQRSFGFIIDYQFLVFDQVAQAKINYSGLTNRFANPDSSRLDELELYLRFPVWYFRDNVRFSATAGAIVAGNLGGQELQNKFHDAIGVAPIVLPYKNATTAFGFLGGSVWLLKRLDFWDFESYFNLESNIDFKIAPSYNQTFKIELGPTVSNTRNDAIAFKLGYANTQAYFENAALHSVARTETGFLINYTMKLGIVNFGFTVFPNNQFTMGYLGITLLQGVNEMPLKKVDVTTEIGALSDDRGLFIRYLWNKAGADNNKWLLDAHYQFWTLGKKYIPDAPKTLGNYQQFTLGANYHFITPKNKLQAIPYLSARTGFKQTQTFSGQQPAPTVSNFNAMFVGEAGVRLKFPTNIAKKNCFYGLTPSYTMANTFGANKQTEFYFGFAGFVMVDF